MSMDDVAQELYYLIINSIPTQNGNFSWRTVYSVAQSNKRFLSTFKKIVDEKCDLVDDYGFTCHGKYVGLPSTPNENPEDYISRDILRLINESKYHLLKYIFDSAIFRSLGSENAYIMMYQNIYSTHGTTWTNTKTIEVLKNLKDLGILDYLNRHKHLETPDFSGVLIDFIEYTPARNATTFQKLLEFLPLNHDGYMNLLEIITDNLGDSKEKNDVKALKYHRDILAILKKYGVEHGVN